MINGKTFVLGIIGNPVSHSMSPAMHNAALKELGLNGVYVPFPVENVAQAVTGVKGLTIRGLSVTIPHKETVIPFLDDIDPVARRIGAVNTVALQEDEEGNELLRGFNTDWLGANRALSETIALKDKQVILLGAGGAARAIGFGLQEAGATVLLCSRTEKKGQALAHELGCKWASLGSLSDLKGDIVVNATSVGMKPNIDDSLMTVEQLARFKVVMDIVYSPLDTKLLKNGQDAGCITIGGLEMLLYQGVAQFELWTSKTAPVELMREKLYEIVTIQ